MANINGCLLGLYEKALPADLSWEERLTSAKSAGYDFIEISIDETDERLSRMNWPREQREELRNLLYRHSMPILSMCLSGNRRYPIGSENDEIRKKGVCLIKDAVDFSQDIGIRIIQLAGYDEYYNESNDRTRELFLHALMDVVEYSASRGICLALETVDTDLVDSIENAMKFIRMIGSPYLQVYPDIGNITAMGKDVDKDFRSGKGHIVAIHLKDTLPGKFRDIPYGSGTVDFAAFFQLLQSMDYKGLLVAEMWATEDREASIGYVGTARSYLLNKYEEAILSIDGKLANRKV